MHHWKLPLAVLVYVASTPVSLAQTFAAYLTGNDLLAYCNSGVPTHLYYCAGYVTAAVDHDRGLMSVLKAKPNFCIPATVTSKQLADIALAYLQANPATLHYAATGAVVTAIGEAFPCR